MMTFDTAKIIMERKMINYSVTNLFSIFGS